MQIGIWLQINTLEEPFLDVDCEHVKTFDPKLHRQLVSYPQEVSKTVFIHFKTNISFALRK